MKNNYIFIIFVFIFSYVGAQTRLDSLYSVWEDKTQPDSIRIRAFDDYIWEGYLFSQPDSAMVLAKQLFEFSSLKNNNMGIASALKFQGDVYEIKSEYLKALDYYQRSLKIRKEVGDKKSIASSLNSVGNVYSVQGVYANALNYYQRSLKIRKEIGDKNGIAGSLNNIGNIYSDQGDNLKALDYQIRSLSKMEETGDKQGVSVILNNIGASYARQSDYVKALDYFNRSLMISQEMGDKEGFAMGLGNIGTIYDDQADYVKALEYHQRALIIMEEIGNKEGIANAFSHIGTIYVNQGDYLKAITNCKKGLDLSEKTGRIFKQKESCECLYEAYKAQGNDNKALAYHEQILLLSDSLQKEGTVKKLQRMEFAKQVQADSLVQVEKAVKVEMAHQAEVRKKDRNRNLAVGAGIFFLVLSGGFYSRWRYIRKSKQIIEKEKDRSENLLLNILPYEIAEELKLKGIVDAQDFDQVSVLFTDFKGFTTRSEKLSARDLVKEINHCFKAFDHICEKYKIEKIKTIGDAYMAGGGLPVPSDDAVKNTVLAALEMQAFMTDRIAEKRANNEVPFEMRLGINTGPVVAGIVGVKKFQYDIWGDTVNTASRMESSGEIGEVNISQATYKIIKDDPQFAFVSRGKIQAKGKGEVEMYFVSLKEAA